MSFRVSFPPPLGAAAKLAVSVTPSTGDAPSMCLSADFASAASRKRTKPYPIHRPVPFSLHPFRTTMRITGWSIPALPGMAVCTRAFIALAYACSPCTPPTHSSQSLASFGREDSRFCRSFFRRSARDFLTASAADSKSGGSNVGDVSSPFLMSAAAAARPPWDAHHAPHSAFSSL